MKYKYMKLPPLKILFTTALLFIFCMACKKDNKACWQAFDWAGIDVRGLVICDKTQEEAQAAYPQFWFYNSNEAKYCWRLQPANAGVSYTGNIPQSMADKMWAAFGYTYTKIDCNSFCKWKIFEKSKSKITGFFQPVSLYYETYTTDTCSKLFVGRVVTVRETTDSLITREFIEKF
jgi:hypothetical protein